MGRFPQRHDGVRGSLQWVQYFVNEAPDVLNAAIGIGPICWCSPLSSDEYSEYRDLEVLDLLGITLPKRSLSSFWPTRGPQWDAFGRADSGEIVLVEAKAHVGELLSGESHASAAESVAQIQSSLSETAKALAATSGAVDWSKKFYQYTNRLAHAYLFRQINDIPTLLVFLYFIGDHDMNGPTDRREWDAALAVLHEALGLRGRIPSYVKDAFLDVPKPIVA